jgi:hypothetical protein
LAYVLLLHNTVGSSAIDTILNVNILIGGLMKMRKLLSALLVCAFVFSIIGPVMASEETTITGMVQQVEEEFVIVTADDEYIVKDHDLSEMVGKMVTAIGTVTEEEDEKTIEVTSVVEAH